MAEQKAEAVLQVLDVKPHPGEKPAKEDFQRCSLTERLECWKNVARILEKRRTFAVHSHRLRFTEKDRLE